MIACASGCTTAVPYHYSEDGKQHPLREVIRRTAAEAEFLISDSQAGSPGEYLIELSQMFAQDLQQSRRCSAANDSGQSQRLWSVPAELAGWLTRT